LAAGVPALHLTTASILSDFWHDQLVEHNRQGLFLVLVGFLGSFGFIRFSTRLMRSPHADWWPGSVVSDSGVHLHHLVWGISLMLAAGALSFALFDVSPWYEICACLFGIGAGLTIDEFALWVYLDDVYWAKEGRASIDAVVIATAAMLLVLVGARPFDVSTGTAADLFLSLGLAAVELLLVFACFAKQRVLHGAVGLFFFPVAIYGAVRIAKPGSPWAKRRYGERDPAKQAKAVDRFRPDRRTERFKERFRDVIGGATEEVYDAKLEQEGATAQAAAEVRGRAERQGET
jgi:hypothetical protein